MTSSDEVLDAAKGFQSGFETYLPLYADHTGAELDFRKDVVEPYDTLRGIDFQRLSDMAGGCATIAGQFRETMDTLHADVGTHTSGWRGDTSDAFLAHLQRFGTTARSVDEDLGTLADTTTDAVTAVRQVLRDYTDALSGIDWSDVDPPGTVELLIAISRGDPDVREPVEKLHEVLGIAPPAVGKPITGSWVADVAKEYLDTTLVAPFDANKELFDSATRTATEATAAAFAPVVDAAGRIKPVTFDRTPNDGRGGETDRKPDAPAESGKVVVEDGDRTITVTGLSGPGDEVDVTITDPDGTSTEYEIGLDANGRPELGPDSPDSATASTPDAAAADAADTADPAGGGAGGGSVHGSGGGGVVHGAGGGTPQTAVGSLPAGTITHAGPVATGPGTSAAVANVAAGPAAGGGGQGGAAGMGMMPMGMGMGNQGGGDEERGPSQWRVMGDLLTPEEQAELDNARGVIGEDPADQKTPAAGTGQ